MGVVLSISWRYDASLAHEATPILASLAPPYLIGFRLVLESTQNFIERVLLEHELQMTTLHLAGEHPGVHASMNK